MITVTHTSPAEITKIDSLGGCAGNGTLFFSTNDYSMGSVAAIYDLDLSDDEIITAKELHDDEIISEISVLFSVDAETAESLLDATGSEWDHDCDAEKSWALQGLRAECAQKMGFVACEDEDENGAVYMIKMNVELLNRLVKR